MRDVVNTHCFARYYTMPPHSDVGKVAPDNCLRLNNVLAVEDDVLRPTEDTCSRNPVAAGGLYVLGFVEWDVRQLHFICL